MRFKKDGTPYKADFERAKKNIKQNFDTIKPENLSPVELKYYNRVKGARKGVLKRERDEKGHLLGKQIAKKVKEAINDFEKENAGVNVRADAELLEIVMNSVRSKNLEYTENTNKIENKVEKYERENKLFVYDGNKTRKVSLEKYTHMVAQLTQHLNIYNKNFAMYTRVTITPNDEMIVFLPMEALNYEGEDLAVFLDDFKKDFTAIGS